MFDQKFSNEITRVNINSEKDVNMMTERETSVNQQTMQSGEKMRDEILKKFDIDNIWKEPYGFYDLVSEVISDMGGRQKGMSGRFDGSRFTLKGYTIDLHKDIWKFPTIVWITFKGYFTDELIKGLKDAGIEPKEFEKFSWGIDYMATISTRNNSDREFCEKFVTAAILMKQYPKK